MAIRPYNVTVNAGGGGGGGTAINQVVEFVGNTPAGFVRLTDNFISQGPEVEVKIGGGVNFNENTGNTRRLVYTGTLTDVTNVGATEVTLQSNYEPNIFKSNGSAFITESGALYVGCYNANDGGSSSRLQATRSSNFINLPGSHFPVANNSGGIFSHSPSSKKSYFAQTTLTTNNTTATSINTQLFDEINGFAAPVSQPIIFPTGARSGAYEHYGMRALDFMGVDYLFITGGVYTTAPFEAADQSFLVNPSTGSFVVLPALPFKCYSPAMAIVPLEVGYRIYVTACSRVAYIDILNPTGTGAVWNSLTRPNATDIIYNIATPDYALYNPTDGLVYIFGGGLDKYQIASINPMDNTFGIVAARLRVNESYIPTVVYDEVAQYFIVIDGCESLYNEGLVPFVVNQATPTNRETRMRIIKPGVGDDVLSTQTPYFARFTGAV